MTQGFRSFVIFAGMRTGSNLLEATLNAVKRVTCFGEAFNPYMMGWPGKDEMLGITRAEREADPLSLLAKLTDKPGHLPGFRYFHDHDPRVLEPIIQDRGCAKIILTRNPLDSYVSTRLAWETNQWKLNESETPIPARITYDGDEFRRTLSEAEEFRRHVVSRLQATGQTAFHLGFDDLRDGDVITGLLHWLGRTDLARVEPARDAVLRVGADQGWRTPSPASTCPRTRRNWRRRSPISTRCRPICATWIRSCCTACPCSNPGAGLPCPVSWGRTRDGACCSCRSRAGRNRRSGIGWTGWARSRTVLPVSTEWPCRQTMRLPP